MAVRFNSKQLEQRGFSLGRDGLYSRHPDKADAKPKAKVKRLPRKQSPNISNLLLLLRADKVPHETEYKFLPDRKFRFDIAFPQKKVAFEYNGGIYMKKSGHTNKAGYQRNMEKLNLAQMEGWKVLQYTNEDFKDGGIQKVVKQILTALNQ